jgi:hypothetical protein
VITFEEITMAPTGEHIQCGPFAKRELKQVVNDVQVRLNGSYLTVIPAGFKSDGMSLPWWQITWDDPWHYRYIAAALLHDWLLTQDLEKHFVDWLFEGALLSFGVPALEVWIFKNAVRTKRRTCS